MSIYSLVQDKAAWEEFITYEEDKFYPDQKVLKLVKRILEYEEYKLFTKQYMDNFPIPRLVKIGAYNTSKKRVVYVYPEPHRTILKLVGRYLLENYNDRFCRNSLAYTQGRSVRSAFRLVDEFKLSLDEPVYKNDFSDYFNSINLDRLNLELMKFLDENDVDTRQFIMKLLREPKVQWKHEVIEEHKKGVMAGSPIAGILANIFMHEIDQEMLRSEHSYIRYADDTLIVGEDALKHFKERIEAAGIVFNPKKMATMTLREGITFLGFEYKGNKIDISPKAKAKMKSRLKRRAKWYRRWMIENNVPPRKAIRDYIRKINFKIYSDQDDSINWSRWYLPNINVTDSLHYLDLYFVNCIRYLNSGTWHRGRKFYSLKYKDIKKFGYKSLVNEYFRLRKVEIVVFDPK